MDAAQRRSGRSPKRHDGRSHDGKVVPLRQRPAAGKRKIVAFEPETWQALDLLARDSMRSFQELADEAFRDLLKKHGRPDELRAALRKSAARAEPPTRVRHRSR